MARAIFRRLRARRAGIIGWAILFLAAPACAGTSDHRPTPIAVVDFDYVDTSGEAPDQTASHRARLDAFMRAVRNDLAKSGKYRVVPLVCRPGPCSVAGSDASELLEAARNAGAKLLLFGGIHKESTLVQWAEAQVVDVQANKVVFDRLLSFRGDTDEAWQRAEEFLVRELDGGLASMGKH